jgi:adaptin ear-binding coat-associated protein 1/2
VHNDLEIRLEDKTSGMTAYSRFIRILNYHYLGALFARAPILKLNSVDFESVSDSSRYFVIRLRNDNGQTAFVGIGFSDRSDSFDLNVAIQDHFKTLAKCENDDQPNAPKLDLSFKEGW